MAYFIQRFHYTIFTYIDILFSFFGIFSPSPCPLPAPALPPSLITDHTPSFTVTSVASSPHARAAAVFAPSSRMSNMWYDCAPPGKDRVQVERFSLFMSSFDIPATQPLRRFNDEFECEDTPIGDGATCRVFRSIPFVALSQPRCDTRL